MLPRQPPCPFIRAIRVIRGKKKGSCIFTADGADEGELRRQNRNRHCYGTAIATNGASIQAAIGA